MTKEMQINYRNIQVALEGVQNIDNDEIYFIEAIMTKFHCTKMKEWLSINDISLTCVALKKIIEIGQKEERSDTPKSKDRSLVPNFDNMSDMGTNQDMVAYENNTRTIVTESKSSVSSGISKSSVSSGISDLTRTSSWNSQFCQKNNNGKVAKVEDLAKIKVLLETDERFTIFNTGKKFTGGNSGTVHGWLLNGVEEYKHIRNKLQENIKDYETVHFDLKKKSSKTDLGEFFNKKHQE